MLKKYNKLQRKREVFLNKKRKKIPKIIYGDISLS